MNLTLKRTDYRDDGIYGFLLDESQNQVSVTLEHAFDSGLGNGSYVPKIAAGTYTCVRHPATPHLPYEKFQLLNVPDFQGKAVTEILIHIGNFNSDSDGCILVGRRVAPSTKTPGENMITSSGNTFGKIMDLQVGLTSFTLTIS